MFKNKDESTMAEQMACQQADQRENGSEGTEIDKLQVGQLSQRSVQPNRRSIFHYMSDYCEILRQFVETCRIGELDLIFKHLNKHNYWFFISSLYFKEASQSDIDKLQSFRTRLPIRPIYHIGDPHAPNYSTKEGYDLSDDLFILENRSLIRHKKQLQTLEDVRDTSLDSLIQMWEEILSEKASENEDMIDRIGQEMGKAKAGEIYINDLLGSSQYRSNFPTFEYVQLEDQEMQRSRQRHYKDSLHEGVCQACVTPQFQHGNPILQCVDCGTKIHTKCYPLQNTDPEFRCYACTIEMPEDQVICCLCYCKGGNVLPTTLLSNNPMLGGRFCPPPNYYLQDGPTPTKIKIVAVHPVSNQKPKQMVVHASCFRWHGELFFDETVGKVSGFEGIKPKKWLSTCSVCQTTEGCCIDCIYHGCQNSFHAQCARRSGVWMTSYKKTDKLFREIYCSKHREKYQYQIMEENRWKKIGNLHKTFEALEKLDGGPGSSYDKKHKKSKLDSSKKYCVCKQEYKGQDMIQCEHCLEWYHFDCVKVQDREHFICDTCV